MRFNFMVFLSENVRVIQTLRSTTWRMRDSGVRAFSRVLWSPVVSATSDPPALCDLECAAITAIDLEVTLVIACGRPHPTNPRKWRHHVDGDGMQVHRH
ncbi:hypothetical protein [Agromyces sp. NPDC049794]|uniref:hypothetical protein n=1 Tax=Agromyces sp. NPDC049794 TaxID=3154362 RepID=UPI0033E25769